MRDHDAVMPDLLSHGASAKWDPRLPGTSLDAQVDHVITILDSLGLRTALSVVGNSYGGGVAAVLTERHPERVARLVIYDGLVSDYTSALADSIARAAGGEGMLAIMRTPTPRDLRLGIRLSLYRDPPLPGFLLRQIFEENVRPFRAAQILLIQDLMQHEERFATRRFNRTVPVFVIWGERDELIPNTTGRAILHRNSIPETHWTVIPRTGHVANMERPRAFVRALEQVLGR
jgi:pimeloyl-ACP methyl ester carboxylesterase